MAAACCFHIFPLVVVHGDGGACVIQAGRRGCRIDTSFSKEVGHHQLISSGYHHQIDRIDIGRDVAAVDREHGGLLIEHRELDGCAVQTPYRPGSGSHAHAAAGDGGDVGRSGMA